MWNRRSDESRRRRVMTAERLSYGRNHQQFSWINQTSQKERKKKRNQRPTKMKQQVVGFFGGFAPLSRRGQRSTSAISSSCWFSSQKLLSAWTITNFQFLIQQRLQILIHHGCNGDINISKLMLNQSGISTIGSWAYFRLID